MELLTRRLWCSKLYPSLLLRAGQVSSLQLSSASGLAPSLNKQSNPINVFSFFNFHFQNRTLHHCATTTPPTCRIPPKALSLLGSQQGAAVVAVQVRSIVNHRWVNYSKDRGKKKSVKAVMKRFHRTGSGKLKYWPAGKVHNMLCKSRGHRQRLRKPRYANKKQLKKLNKMIAGW